MLSGEDFRLDGRVALVAGAGRGIGAAVAEAFATAGAKLVVSASNDQEVALASLAERIRARAGVAHAVPADSGEDAAAAHLVSRTLEHFGSLDVLVCCTEQIATGGLRETGPGAWDAALRAGLTTGFLLARHALPGMCQQGWGRIVLVAAGENGKDVDGPAEAVQAGLQGLARAIAREFGSEGVTANSVVPAAIDTAPGRSRRFAAEVPLARLGSLDEVAAACLFLASTAGGFVNGQALRVDGGWSMT